MQKAVIFYKLNNYYSMNISMHKVKYKILSCSSEENIKPVSNLLQNSKDSPGW